MAVQVETVLFRRNTGLKLAVEQEARRRGLAFKYLNINQINQVGLVIATLGKITLCELNIMMQEYYRPNTVMMIKPDRSWNILARRRCNELQIDEDPDGFLAAVYAMGFPFVKVGDDNGELARWGVDIILSNFVTRQ